jgi:hypothetical protein
VVIVIERNGVVELVIKNGNGRVIVVIILVLIIVVILMNLNQLDAVEDAVALLVQE